MNEQASNDFNRTSPPLAKFAIDNIADASLWFDESGQITYSNKSATSLLGYSAEEFLSLKLFDIDPEYKPENWGVRWQQIRQHGAMTIQTNHKTKAGRLVPVEVSGNFITYDGTEYIVSFARDMSERINLKEQISRYESQIRQMFERSPVGIFRTTPDGQIVISNRSILEMMKYDSVEAMNEVGLNSIYENEEDRQKLIRMVKEMGVAEFETRVKQADGQVIDIKLNAYPILDQDGNLQFLEGNIQDISDRKNTERMLNKTLSEKETLIRDIHHRVKNNMAMIINFLSLEMQNVEAGEDVNIVNSYQNSISRIFILSEIYSLLYQSGNSPEEADCSEFFISLINMIQSLYPEKSNISITREVQKITLPLKTLIPLGLMTNEIISNSFKYAFEGEKNGEISVRIREEGSIIRMNISDDGVGIAKDYNELKFHSLGIRLIENFIEQLGGECEVKTPPGVEYAISFARS